MLSELRVANIRRNEEWDPKKRITPLFRAVELGGEVGELMNIVKKLERERIGIRGSRTTIPQLAEEMADVLICLDLLGMEYDIDLELATRDKFNATSDKYNLSIRMDSCPE